MDEVLSFKPAGMTPSRERSAGSIVEGVGSRKRPRLPVAREEAGILKKAHLSGVPINIDFGEDNDEVEGKRRSGDLSSTSEDVGLEISEEERMRILQLVENEPEVR